MIVTDQLFTLSGQVCGRRYERELETHFRDCILFYLDGKIRFERYCYGEAAGLVFASWGNGLADNGTILWEKEPSFESARQALPRILTDIQENGTALQFDSQRKRYLLTEEFTRDPANGYGRWKVWFLRRKLCHNFKQNRKP